MNYVWNSDMYHIPCFYILGY